MATRDLSPHACRLNAVPGYYVVNGQTNLTAAGPFEEWSTARAEAERRNAIVPETPGLLKVAWVRDEDQ